jgi:hypothetical protein
LKINSRNSGIQLQRDTWRSSTATRPWSSSGAAPAAPKTLEDRNIFEMMIRRSFGEITLELTAEQFARLNR